MGKGGDPSPRKRGKVEALLKLGTMTQREIGKSVGLSQKAVYTIKQRLDFGLTSSPQRSTSGRKKIITPRAKRILVSECRKNRKMTSKQLQDVMEQHGKKVSASCIRRHLIQAGYTARRPRKKPLLNEKQKARRLQWAVQHKGWSEEDWKKVTK